MKIYSIDNSQPNFKAKISQRFVNSMRGYINNGENRLKNNYQLTQKLEEYAKFGYDDYTIEMHQKSGSLGLEYRLIAVKDGDSAENGVIINKKPLTSYRKIFNRFMTLNKHDFTNIMKAGTKQ